MLNIPYKYRIEIREVDIPHYNYNGKKESRIFVHDTDNNTIRGILGLPIIKIKDNLKDIFVTYDYPSDNIIIVCQLIGDDRAKILYKININTEDLIEDEDVIQNYIKEIKDDDNLELSEFMYNYIKGKRNFYITVNSFTGESDHPKTDK